MNEEFLHKKLNERKEQGALRSLRLPKNAIDFCSNDYLGIVRNNLLLDNQAELNNLNKGSTGSRLLTGNYALIEKAEKEIAAFHGAEAALIFNSGYDANLGLLGAVPQRGDTILYDNLSHASIRDGARLSLARSLSYHHNDLSDLEAHLQKAEGNIFVVTESVFSMDGDIAPLNELADLTERFSAHLIVDEAHATGVFGERGEGITQGTNIHDKCFARVYTFGKALGTHGAAIVGSNTLKQYLINFSRSFVYTTALPENAVAAILNSYDVFPTLIAERAHLQVLVSFFQEMISLQCGEKYEILKSDTPIQGIIIPGNENTRQLALRLQNNGFDVRPILYPTVAKGKERLRIILHAFNTLEEVENLVALLL